MGFGADFSQSVNFFADFCQERAKTARQRNRGFAKLVNKICTDHDGFFHKGHPQRKTGKYLLITPSFPHSPQFYPQGLSTAFHTCGNPLLTPGSPPGRCRGNPHFLAAVVFYHSDFFVQKYPLDSPCGLSGNMRQFSRRPSPAPGHGGKMVQKNEK